jgi:hypothetical protein
MDPHGWEYVGGEWTLLETIRHKRGILGEKLDY